MAEVDLRRRDGDDIERTIIVRYVNEHIVPCSPFESIDREGVGAFVKMAVADGRAANPEPPHRRLW